jgi:hypothetical protein
VPGRYAGRQLFSFARRQSPKYLSTKGFYGLVLSVVTFIVAGMTQVLDPPTGANPVPPERSVLDGLALAGTGLAEAWEAPLWPLSSAELTGALDEIVAVQRRAEAVYLRLLDELDTRGLPTSDGARNTTSWLRERYRLSPGAAKADVIAAAATRQQSDPHTDASRGDLAELGQSLADGSVSRAHVDVAARCLERIPTQLRAKHHDKLAEFFHRQSLSFPANDCDRLARQLLATIDPDRTDRYDPRAYERRSLSAVFDSTGMLLLRGQLDPAAAAIVKAALDHYAAPKPASDDSEESDTDRKQPEKDPRSSGQRYADALTTICQLAMAADHAGTRGSEPARVVVHTTPEQLAGVPGSGLAVTDSGTPLAPGTLQRFACDAILERITVDGAGRVLNYGRSIRLATPAQRRALAVRDGGCAHPDCSAPPAWCDAHHIDWWTRGGPTDLDNMCLLCAQHHTEIHTETWTIIMRDGLPYFVPPYQRDPTRTPRRNCHHDAHREARHLGTRIRLDLDP